MTAEDSRRLKAIIRNFKNKRILVLGDLMLDRFIWGEVSRISPEAPVPVVEVKKETLCHGGAGNVGHNLESLGARALLVGVVGADMEGEWVRNHVSDPRGIVVETKRPTVVKTRIIAHQQQVVRVDKEDKNPISARARKHIIDFIRQEDYDGILISDYNKGLISKALMREILPYAKRRGVSVFVDPKVDNVKLFSPITLLTPNHHEAEQIVHHPCDTDEQAERAGKKILTKMSVKYLILKRGENGMSVFERGKKPVHIPTRAREVYDVTGAGDTVISAASLALLSGAAIVEAAVLANAAAGVVVGKIGTASLSADELLQAIS